MTAATTHERQVSHRATRAPLPYGDAPYGSCRWCGGEILRDDGSVNKRRNWHPACVDEYRETWPQAWRRRVLARDGGVCAACPDDAGPHVEWDADHILPLIDGGTWAMDNAQTLCRAHHREKTGRENSERAMRGAELAKQASTASDPGSGVSRG